ncbi:DHHA1 domain-containing protein [Geoglobus acetivorans]
MFEMLRVEARKAAKILEGHDFARIYTHYDADGISAGAVISAALYRMGKAFHLSFLSGLNEKIDVDDDLIIFADMGSGYPDIISDIDADVVVVDHHFPVGRIEPKKEFAHINPHLAGIDGSYELSASGTAYVFAKELGDNTDLSSVALVGIIGDKQKISGGNAEIIGEGVKEGYIEQKEGLRMISGKIRDVLRLSLEPFLDFYSKEDELEEFLSQVGIDGEKEFDELSRDEERKLANGIVLRILKMNSYPGVVEDFTGMRFYLKAELIQNAVMMSEVVNATGRKAANAIGLAICLRDESFLDKGFELWREFTEGIHEEIERRRHEVQEGECIRYLVMENGTSTGPIASVFSRYLFADRPFIAVNIKKDGRVKVSARSNQKIAEKLDLAEIMRVAAEKVGGRGGGHVVAAGANISDDAVDDFIREVDRLCCSQLSS